MITFFVKILTFMRLCIDKLVDCVFGCYYKMQVRKVPKPTNRLVLRSAMCLAKEIRKQKISCEETVLAFIEQIEQVNPLINAVVDWRFEAALKEARTVDEQIRNHKITMKQFEEKPFLGVPFTSMESIACKGMRNSLGLLCREQKRAIEDANAVKLLKNAGGILIGVTNVSVLDMWQETVNPVYGRSNNPYNCSRTTGGSSGGAAAIIASCGVPFGIGTDLKGSIRLSAFACGIFGHKPTCDLISTKGVVYSTGQELTMLSVGVLTRTSYDIIPLLKVLLDKNINKLMLDEKVNICDLQLYYTIDSDDSKMNTLSSELEGALLRVISHFELKSNFSPQKLNIPNVKYASRLWNFWIKQEANANFVRNLTDRKREGFQALKFSTFFIKYDIGTIINLISYLLPGENQKWACDLTNQLSELLTKKLGNKGVLLYPSAPSAANYHNMSICRPFNVDYCSLWNALKFPVTQVPLGLNSEGLPLGIQVVAAPYQDHLCINVANELEEVFRGYVPPF